MNEKIGPNFIHLKYKLIHYWSETIKIQSYIKTKYTVQVSPLAHCTFTPS